MRSGVEPSVPRTGTSSIARVSGDRCPSAMSCHTTPAMSAFVQEKTWKRVAVSASPKASSTASSPSTANAICAAGMSPASTSRRMRSRSVSSATGSRPAAAGSIVGRYGSCTGERYRPPRSDVPKGVPMKVVVNYDLCESNAVCMGIVPEVFEVRDDDYLYVLQEEPPEELRGKVEEAARRCPKQAISIVD